MRDSALAEGVDFPLNAPSLRFPTEEELDADEAESNARWNAMTSALQERERAEIRHALEANRPGVSFEAALANAREKYRRSEMKSVD